LRVQEALALGLSEPWDAIILDLNLPSLDGLAVLKELRDAEVAVPILILSARDTWKDVGYHHWCAFDQSGAKVSLL